MKLVPAPGGRHPRRAARVRVSIGVWLLVAAAILCADGHWWGAVLLAPAALTSGSLIACCGASRSSSRLAESRALAAACRIATMHRQHPCRGAGAIRQFRRSTGDRNHPRRPAGSGRELRRLVTSPDLLRAMLDPIPRDRPPRLCQRCHLPAPPACAALVLVVAATTRPERS